MKDDTRFAATAAMRGTAPTPIAAVGRRGMAPASLADAFAEDKDAANAQANAAVMCDEPEETTTSMCDEPEETRTSCHGKDNDLGWRFV